MTQVVGTVSGYSTEFMNVVISISADSLRLKTEWPKFLIPYLPIYLSSDVLKPEIWVKSPFEYFGRPGSL